MHTYTSKWCKERASNNRCATNVKFSAISPSLIGPAWRSQLYNHYKRLYISCLQQTTTRDQFPVVSKSEMVATLCNSQTPTCLSHPETVDSKCSQKSPVKSVFQHNIMYNNIAIRLLILHINLVFYRANLYFNFFKF